MNQLPSKEDIYVGIIKLNTNELLISVIEPLEEDLYMLIDPLQMTNMPIMTSAGVQMSQMISPWLQASMDRHFIVTANSIVTVGEANPKMFDMYMSAISSPEYINQYTPEVEYNNPTVEPDVSIKEPILNIFRQNLEKCLNL